jgi:phenylpyruvate tautomerase PptA (4-oxalocrotonate tautomerase family)
MPIYQCSYQRGLLTEDMKAKVAAALDGIQGTGL